MVRRVTGKGLGTFATRDFAAGELLLLELPLLTWPSGIKMTREVIPSTLDTMLIQADPQVRSIFMSLSQAGIHGDLKTPSGVWLTNALPSAEGGGASVYVDACRLNHSCLPNVAHSFGADGMQRLHVISKVRRGDELLLSYIYANEMTRVQRQEKLDSTFGFRCCCVVCSLGGEDLERSDTRRRRMLELKERLDAEVCSTSAELISSVEERLSLQRREGLTVVHCHEEMLAALEACRCGGDMRGASRWALRAADCIRLGVGEDNKTFKRLSEVAALMMVHAGVDATRYAF